MGVRPAVAVAVAGAASRADVRQQAAADRPDSCFRPGMNPRCPAGETTDCWFDEPDPADRRSWAMPSGHGTYQGFALELLDPGDENELTFLIEAQHTELEDALRRDEEVIVGGGPFSPRLHITMHQVVANQLLADDPPGTWQTVQRLAGLGYDWHNVMHMISAVVGEDLHRAVTEPGDRHRRHSGCVEAA